MVPMESFSMRVEDIRPECMMGDGDVKGDMRGAQRREPVGEMQIEKCKLQIAKWRVAVESRRYPDPLGSRYLALGRL